MSRTRGVTFGDLVPHYAEHELVERSESIHPKAHTTIKGYDRVLRNRLLPKWGNRIALSVEPLEVEEWLTTLKKEEELENPTLDRLRRVMSLVYRHGQRYGLIPRTQESNPMRFVPCKTTSGLVAPVETLSGSRVVHQPLYWPLMIRQFASHTEQNVEPGPNSIAGMMTRIYCLSWDEIAAF